MQHEFALPEVLAKPAEFPKGERQADRILATL